MWKQSRMRHNGIKKNMTKDFMEMKDGFRRPSIYFIETLKNRLDIIGEK